MNTIVIIPAHNEEKTIREVITRCKEINVKPLVVDDGSTDDTSEIARQLTTVIRKHKNKGKGEALKSGFHYVNCFTNYEFVVIIDGDLQYDPFEIPKLIEALKTADYVIGQRDWSQVPFRHRVGNYLWVKTFNILFCTDLKDTNCGFIAMRAEVMQRLNVSSGYIVDNDMLMQALEMGFVVKNAPISVRYNDKRNLFSGTRMVMGIFIFIIRRWLNL